MTIRNDLKILYHLMLRPVRGKNHAERMENFYSGQADGYDDFRKRLLQGRELVYETLGKESDRLNRTQGTFDTATAPAQQIDSNNSRVWVDFGGGTGSNLEFIGPSISTFRDVYVVDLATSLLDIVKKRSDRNGWKNVTAVTGDATSWTPPQGIADVVTFSYSLTMIPDWFAAIDNAIRILKPGGKIGVIDFYVSRKFAAEGLKRHSWATRNFWPVWFSSDNVFPSPDHVPYLHRRFSPVLLQEFRAKIPYFPFARTPYYQFIGTKPKD
jgi:S-adenosylmethionine-diacylgycerolhomoserine-N-methlytransferase